MYKIALSIWFLLFCYKSLDYFVYNFCSANNSVSNSGLNESELFDAGNSESKNTAFNPEWNGFAIKKNKAYRLNEISDSEKENTRKSMQDKKHRIQEPAL
ncbi:MAG: hypothetical protein ACD_79C01391G0004 [uncultured bacterium]|nr:MAG: hypothetical protein ACD_79C01391G0004 [uncultured bacterium]